MQRKDAPSENELLISQREFVGSVLATEKLYQLKCFENFSDEQALKATVGNLNVEQNRSEPWIFEVTLCCRRPNDVQTILQKLVSSYKQELTKTKVSSVVGPELDGEPQADPKDENAVAMELIKRLRGENEDPAFELLVMKPASVGEKVWLFRWIIWAVSGLIGFLIGIVLISCIFRYSRSMRDHSMAA